jgi:diacylglycerol kinase (ATP)
MFLDDPDESAIAEKISLPLHALTETPVPGTLALDTLIDNASNPLVCFINSKAGRKQGLLLKEELKRFVKQHQIVDLGSEDPEPALRAFAKLPKYCVLVCGGDGTVGWINGAVQKVHKDMNSMQNVPGVAILPIGTGNDISIATGWGRSFKDGSIHSLLEKLLTSRPVPLDRWAMRVNGSTQGIFQNYLGIGIDASIAMQVDKLRNRWPRLFFSRRLNRQYYGLMGIFDWLRRKFKNFAKDVKVHVDGKEVALPPATKGVIILNINSYGGGSLAWFDDELHRFAPASVSDGLFEVIAVKGPVQLGKVKFGMTRFEKIAQGSHLSVEAGIPLPMHRDGEPWIQDVGAALSVESAGENAYVLRPEEPSEGPSGKFNLF